MRPRFASPPRASRGSPPGHPPAPSKIRRRRRRAAARVPFRQKRAVGRQEPANRAALMCSTNPVSVAVSALSARRTSAKSLRAGAPRRSPPPASVPVEHGENALRRVAVKPGRRGSRVLARLPPFAPLAAQCERVAFNHDRLLRRMASRKSFSVARRMETPAPCVSMSFEMLSAGGRFRFESSAAFDVGEFTATRPPARGAWKRHLRRGAPQQSARAGDRAPDGGVRAEPVRHHRNFRPPRRDDASSSAES